MVGVIGMVGGVMALITVFTTSMIYASLKTIPAWYNIWTKIGYLVLSLMSGAVLAMALTSALGQADVAFHLVKPVGILLVVGLIVKIIYWRHIHSDKAVSTAESATGLGTFGKVSLAASPHSADNYLLQEMCFKIARKHAYKLRWVTVTFGFIWPFLFIGVAMHFMQGMPKLLMILFAAACCLLGLVFERWLFFAEAKHAVTLYYGQDKV